MFSYTFTIYLDLLQMTISLIDSNLTCAECVTKHEYFNIFSLSVLDKNLREAKSGCRILGRLRENAVSSNRLLSIKL